MNKIIGFIIKFPLLIIFIILLITVFFGYQLQFLSINTSTKSLVDENAPYRMYYEKTKNVFGNEEVIFLVLAGKNLFTNNELHKIQDLAYEIEGMDYVNEVASIFTKKKIEGVDGELIVEPYFEFIPETEEEIEEVKNELVNNELFNGRFIAKNGEILALIIYFDDLTEEDVYKKKVVENFTLTIEKKLKEKDIGVNYYLGGSPILRTGAS
ncbi:MAG: hypothetical protein JXB88_21905, partial [Spirochaetales bacterium]|nr:hypothetical protein [Spirochaetales bacterium]